MKFSETLIDLRKEKNLSQQQLANATGLSQSAIAKLEKGRNEATASTLLRLSRYFGVSVDEMLLSVTQVWKEYMRDVSIRYK